VVDENDRRRRYGGEEPEVSGVDVDGWLALTDDELLFQVESLPRPHGQDERLLEVLRSDRHFFVRQEAAKKIEDSELLKAHAGDRHVGQILVRSMNRNEDVAYLERLVAESRHIEVRKAAEVQLAALVARLRPPIE
jgi:hypothetical protein